jgi:hypothetical protein
MKKRDRRLSRRAHFIDQGGDAFLPQERMREIRWEEAVVRSKLKREGRSAITFHHVHFHCPSGCCLGTPIPQEGGEG